MNWHGLQTLLEINFVDSRTLIPSYRCESAVRVVSLGVPCPTDRPDVSSPCGPLCLFPTRCTGRPDLQLGDLQSRQSRFESRFSESLVVAELIHPADRSGNVLACQTLPRQNIGDRACSERESEASSETSSSEASHRSNTPPTAAPCLCRKGRARLRRGAKKCGPFVNPLDDVGETSIPAH